MVDVIDINVISVKGLPICCGRTVTIYSVSDEGMALTPTFPGRIMEGVTSVLLGFVTTVICESSIT